MPGACTGEYGFAERSWERREVIGGMLPEVAAIVRLRPRRVLSILSPVLAHRHVYLCCGLVAGSLLAPPARAQHDDTTASVDLMQDPQQTIRAGQAFRAPLFGEVIERPARDRRDVWGWDLGFAVSPGLDDSDTMPLATLYGWQRDDDHLFRALCNGVANELLYARALGDDGAEWLATFESQTWPGASGEWIDGEIDDRERIDWGFVRPGLGLGWRRQVGAQQDNLAAADLTGEAGALYFGRDGDTAPTFATPHSTLELRLHGKLRVDLLERNLIELPHAGFAAGLDAIFGHRARWTDWGDPAIEAHDGGSTRNYGLLTAYAFGITGVPGVAGERHRLVAAVHTGLGDGTDRFSAQRVGGGPDTRGGEFELTARPVLPGAALGEYFPANYVLGYAGYRFEPAFFAFVDAGITFGQLDRDRQTVGGRERRTDAVTAVSVRLSTGCLGNTRLQLLGAYDFDAVRDGSDGALAIVLQVSGYF